MPKRKAYTVREKLAVITRIRNGESQVKVSKDTGVAESTLRGWLKSEVQLRDFVDSVDGDGGLARKKARTAKDGPLDSAMFNCRGRDPRDRPS